MSEEKKSPEENVEAKVEEQAEATAVVEEKIEETQPAVEEQAEPVAEEKAEEPAEAAEEKSCCLKSGGHLNFWKLATVFLLLAWAVQNWRANKAEEEAKKKMPFYRSALSSPINEDNMVMMEEVDNQLSQAQDYVSMNPRGIAPALEDTPDSLIYKMFIPGLKDYKINHTVNGNVLTVTGAVTVARKAKGQEGVLIFESKSQFNNTVKLPCAVKAGKIKVEKTDNVIQIIMPKVTPTQVAVPEVKKAAGKAAPVKK